MATNKFLKIFVDSIRAMLLLTAFLKLSSASFSAPYLDKQDPVIWFLSVRQLMMLAALIEFAMILFLTRLREDPRSLELVLWIATVFVAYRTLRWMFGGSLECNCLGAIFVRTGDKIAIGMLLWMIGGALTLLVLRKRRLGNSQTVQPRLPR